MPRKSTAKGKKTATASRISTLPGVAWGYTKSTLRFLHRHWLKFLVGIIIGLPVAGIAYFLMAPEKQEYLTEQAGQGTLVQAVEAVGTVISEKDLELKFPITGVVQEVLVKEGDQVEAGQVLARLKSGTITEADVTYASANLQAVQADLQELIEGTRPEEIAIAEADLRNKRASLEAARTTLVTAEANLKKSEQKLDELHDEADISLAGDIASANAVVEQKIASIQTSLSVLDDVFNTSIVENAVEFQQRTELERYERLRTTADAAIADAQRSADADNYEEALDRLSMARDAAADAATAVESAYRVIIDTELTYYFTVSTKETYKNKIATERDDIRTAQAALTTELDALRNATANYRTQIAAEESAVQSAQGTRDKALADISTYEAAVVSQEAQLQLKKAGARQTDIDAARARVNSAYADLQRARARFDDTILTAPIAGRITKVNLKTGEFTGGIEDFARSITMLGDSPYRVEIFVSEIDIPKVEYSQTGAIELDAYQGRDFWATVSEIDPAATLVDGVPKYRVKLDFTEDYDQYLKIGMTGDVDIITDVRVNVVHVPGRSVIRNEAGEQIVRILLPDGTVEDRPVEIGMETTTDIEIVDGVTAGETIIVLIK